MSLQTFDVEVRAKTGGGASRAMRRDGKIPGVLYGAGKENVHFSIDPRDVIKGLNTKGFYSTVFDLMVGDQKEQALCKAVQFHPVTDNPIHIDFWRVSKDSKIHVSVPVIFVNEDKCPGIKHGGILNTVLHSLEVVCAAGNIPSEITIDLAGLEVGASIQTTTVTLPAGAVIAHPERDTTFATIVAPAGGDKA